MAEPAAHPAELKIPREKPPFAGLPARGGAFLVDCVILYYAGRLLEWAGRPTLLGLNPALPYLGHVFAFLYFWIGNGPLTRGRTPGKMILSINVVGANGKPITWPAAARRALIEQFVFFMVADPTYYALLFPAGLRHGAAVMISILSVLALTLLITLIFSIVMHPRKQGWHDQWAGSYVTGDPVPAAFFQVLDSAPDVIAARRMANHLKFTVIFWVIASAVLLVKPIHYNLKADVRQRAADLARLQKAAQPGPYVIVETDYPNVEFREGFMNAVRERRERARARNETVPTTETIHQKLLFDWESILAQCLRRRGAYSSADLNDPDLRAGMTELRKQLWRQWPGKAGGQPPARTFVALLFDPFQFLIYNHRVPQARIHGPADPAAGGLVFEPIRSSSAENAHPPAVPTASTAGPASSAPPKANETTNR